MGSLYIGDIVVPIVTKWSADTAGTEHETRRAQLQSQINDLLAARTNLKAAPERANTLKLVLKRVENKRGTAMEKLTEAQTVLEAAQKEVDVCRNSVDALTAEIVSVQTRLDQALLEMPTSQPVKDQAQQCISRSMALANMAMAASCISPQEQAWFSQMLQRMSHGITTSQPQGMGQAAPAPVQPQMVHTSGDALPVRKPLPSAASCSPASLNNMQVMAQQNADNKARYEAAMQKMQQE